MKHQLSRLAVSAALILALIAVMVPATTAAQAAPKAESKTETKAVPPEFARPSASAPVSEDYVIGAEDVLSIHVWKEPELTRAVPVRPDGKITLPLIGDVTAKGLTAKQLQDSLAKALSAYIASADVTVIVLEVRSQKFNIVGEVQKPGSYGLTGPMTVLDAIATAGGLRDFAKAKKIYLLRVKADGSRERLAFNYKQVIKGENMNQNVRLEPSDTIVVP